MTRALLLTLCSSVALAAPPTTKNVSALILPMDKGAETLMLRIEGYANQSLKEYEGFKVLTSEELFGIAADNDAAAALKRADQGFAESRQAFDVDKNYEDAERKLRATIKEYSKSVAAMKGCGNLCEAIAMYGAVMQARGDTEEAKVALLDLMALAPTFDLDRKRYLQTYLGLKAQVATGRGAQLRGSLTIVTKPAGARVYVNNTLAGYSPVTLNTVPVGKAMVRIERPGFKRVGDLVEISPEEQSMSYELTASSAWKAWDSLMNKLAGEASKDKGGATMTQVANSLKLERAVIGVLKTLDSGTMEFNAGYFDLKTGKRYSWRRSSFQEDEFGQLQGEVGRLVNRLLNEASQDKQALSKDPLKNTSGTEDWAAEDRGGKRDKRDKNSKGGDPLEGASGTEDW